MLADCNSGVVKSGDRAGKCEQRSDQRVTLSSDKCDRLDCLLVNLTMKSVELT